MSTGAAPSSTDFETIPTIDEDLLCPQCGYSLFGIKRNQCPECGEKFDAEKLRTSQIPWSHRKEIGRFRAYWRTVFLVMFRTKTFCTEIVRPVSYGDAKRFQWMTHVYASIGVAMAIVCAAVMAASEHDIDIRFWSLDLELDPTGRGMIIFWIVLAAMTILWLFLASAVHTYWFHPRYLPIRQQNRSLAISFYACAPLAVMPVTLGASAVLLTIIFFVETQDGAIGLSLNVTRLAIVLLICLQVFGAWLIPLMMVARAAGRGPGGICSLAVLMPLFWFVLALLIFIVLPLGILIIALAIVTI